MRNTTVSFEPSFFPCLECKNLQLDHHHCSIPPLFPKQQSIPQSHCIQCLQPQSSTHVFQHQVRTAMNAQTHDIERSAVLFLLFPVAKTSTCATSEHVIPGRRRMCMHMQLQDACMQACSHCSSVALRCGGCAWGCASASGVAALSAQQINSPSRFAPPSRGRALSSCESVSWCHRAFWEMGSGLGTFRVTITRRSESEVPAAYPGLALASACVLLAARDFTVDWYSMRCEAAAGVWLGGSLAWSMSMSRRRTSPPDAFGWRPEIARFACSIDM